MPESRARLTNELKLNVTPEQHEELRDLARRRSTSQAHEVRAALASHLARSSAPVEQTPQQVADALAFLADVQQRVI